MIEVVPARPQHIGPVATRMRYIDRLECRAVGQSPKDALRTGLMGASAAWTVKIDGRPEAMFGVAPISMIEGRGRPWLLMTPEGAAQHKALMRLGTIYTQAMQSYFPVLENWVHADNDRSIRWLARLGYAIGAVDVIRGLPMRPFVRYHRS